MVTHKAWLVMLKSSVHKYLSKLDFLVLILATIGHDAGHLGRTNAYEVRVQPPWQNVSRFCAWHPARVLASFSLSYAAPSPHWQPFICCSICCTRGGIMAVLESHLLGNAALLPFCTVALMLCAALGADLF